MGTKKNIKRGYPKDYLRDISVYVYKERLGELNVQKILDDPKRGEDAIVRNSEFYDTVVRVVLDAVHVYGLKDREKNITEEENEND